MKKIFIALTLISAFALVSTDSNAQNVTKKMTTTLTSAVDSIRCDGAASNYLYINPTRSYLVASFQSVIRRISTAIGGVLTLQASNDGTNWYATAASDTIHVTNGATDGAILTLPASTGVAYKNYRFKCNGLASDTMEVKVIFNGR